MAVDRKFYYESLKGRYEKLQSWADRAKHRPLWARAVDAAEIPIALLWIACLVPVLPQYIAALVQPHLSGTNSIAVFVATWVLLAAASSGLLWLQGKLSGRGWHKPPVKLSRQQLTFVEAHTTHRELEIYFATSQEGSLDEALKHARKVFTGWAVSDPVMMDLDMAQFHGDQQWTVDMYCSPGWRAEAERMATVLDLQSTEPWYELTNADRERLSALVELGPRVLENLEAKSSLRDVAQAVDLLADYALQMLPEVASKFEYDPAGRRDYLRRLVDDIAKAVSRLPQGAKVERWPTQPRERSLRKIWTRWALVRALAYALGCFALLLAPVAVIVEILRTFLKMSDDAYAGAVVAATAVFAVGLMNWLPVRRPGEAPALGQGSAPRSDTPPTPPA